MPPKKADTLAGRSVLAPASLWPDYPLPRGKKGWSGERFCGGSWHGRDERNGMKHGVAGGVAPALTSLPAQSPALTAGVVGKKKDAQHVSRLGGRPANRHCCGCARGRFVCMYTGQTCTQKWCPGPPPRRLQHYVSFPDSGDAQKYFFLDKDIAGWLVDEEEQETAPAPAPAAAPGSRKKPAASGGAAAKRKEAAVQKEQQQEEEGRASKKGKAAAAGAWGCAAAASRGCKLLRCCAPAAPAAAAAAAAAAVCRNMGRRANTAVLPGVPVAGQRLCSIPHFPIAPPHRPAWCRGGPASHEP